MKCPYDMGDPQCDCFRIGPYDTPEHGPCNKCDVPNPLKAKYFCMPELFDEKKWRKWRDKKKEAEG